MVENAAKAFNTNITLTYVRVPVHMRVQLGLRVISMNHRYVLEPQAFRCGLDQLRQPMSVRNVKTRDIAMTCVQAVADGYLDILPGQFSDGGQFV